MLEKDIQTACIHEARAEGWVAVRINGGTFSNGKRPIDSYRIAGMLKNGNKGLSDLILLKDNRVMLVEIKRPGGILRESQRLVKIFMNQHGIDYHVATSSSDMIELLHKNRI